MGLEILNKTETDETLKETGNIIPASSAISISAQTMMVVCQNYQQIKDGINAVNLSFRSSGSEYTKTESLAILEAIFDWIENMDKMPIRSGTTANRPTQTVPGQQYFDTTLDQPIWRNAANDNWVDATGTTA